MRRIIKVLSKFEFVSFSYDWNFVFIMYVNLKAKMTKLTMKYLFSYSELKEIKQGYFRLRETNKKIWVFFNILYSANANRFSAYGNSIFLVRAILLLLEIISVIKSGSFFRLLERSVSMKSFIPASRNEICVYWKQYSFILSFFC